MSVIVTRGPILYALIRIKVSIFTRLNYGCMKPKGNRLSACVITASRIFKCLQDILDVLCIIITHQRGLKIEMQRHLSWDFLICISTTCFFFFFWGSEKKRQRWLKSRLFCTICVHSSSQASIIVPAAPGILVSITRSALTLDSVRCLSHDLVGERMLQCEKSGGSVLIKIQEALPGVGLIETTRVNTIMGGGCGAPCIHMDS